MGNAPPPDEEMAQPINLMRGWPNPSLLPTSLIKEAATTALSDLSIAQPGLLYGPDPGYEPCRVAIAQWLTTFYRTPTTSIPPSRLCITGGASQNLGCLLSVYSDPEYTRAIWIVAPAYFLAFRVFEDAGFAGKMRAVPEKEEGPDLEYLRKEIEKTESGRVADRPRYKPERKRAKVYKHIIYCVPTFANPSSRTMTAEKRVELVRLAREFDALVVADDVYDFLQWPADTESKNDAWTEKMQAAHLPRLVDVDRDIDGGAESRQGADGFGNACSNGSFSKIAGPGIRVGWAEGTKKFAYGVSQTGTTASGGAPSQLTSTYVVPLLTSGSLQHHIKHTLQPAYARRYGILMRAVSTHLLPLGFGLPQSSRDVVGGYFVWLSLPSGLTADVLARKCREQDVIVAPGSVFEVPGDEGVSFESNIRLCFAWEEEASLAEGVRRVGRCARQLLADGKGSQSGLELPVRDEKGLGDFK